MGDLDAEIDALYALPLAEFTVARNALAKRFKGPDAATIKALQKPTAVPFAVNQLYWHERRAYDRLMSAGDALRRAQLGALSGASTDVATAQSGHRQALAAAVVAATHAAEERGVKPQAEPLNRMLEALSLRSEGPSPAGRLVDLVEPAGFEAFAALAAALPASLPNRRATIHQHTPRSQTTRRSEREEAEAREQRLAEEAAERRAAEAAVERARTDLEQALSTEQRAQALVDLVQQQLDAATRSLRDAAAAVTRARTTAKTAQALLARLPGNTRDR